MLEFPGYSNMQSGLRPLCIDYGFASTTNQSYIQGKDP